MLLPGARVGDYRIRSHIGSGGFAAVYKAESLRDGAMVALKVLPLTLDEDLIAAERLGASLQRRFEQAHGMVPRTFEDGQDEHYFYVPMACIDGPSLEAQIRQGPFDPARAAQVAVAICRFLELAHCFKTDIDGVSYDKIIHADLKPSHIFVSDGRITVLDFGIAKALEKSRTAKTIKFVSPQYASPQRLLTGRCSAQDDLWALGVILYEMIGGKRPHSTIEDPPTYRGLSQAIEGNAERDPLPPSCPMALAAIVDKLLVFQEELRYESADSVRADLEAFLRHELPGAVKRFVTSPTVRTDAQQRAIASLSPVVPTVPRPAEGPPEGPPRGEAQRAAAAPNAPPQDAASLSMRTVRPGRWPLAIVRRPAIRRSAWIAALLLLTTLCTSEAVAWVDAERIRAGLPALEGREVAARREQYDRLRRWSLFHLGARLRLDGPLKDRLITVANAVIGDYRQEEPSVAEVQWRQAEDALDWASELGPDDKSLLPKELICKGHLDRIAAQTRPRPGAAEAQRLYDRAIDEFERAARLDPGAADPYLGLSRIYIYGRKDVDRGAAAIHEAEIRGHKPGWRERAQIGDGYRVRADDARRKARRAGESREQMLESARDDYARCVDAFAAIADKARSKDNRDYCQRHLDALNHVLAANPAR